MMLHHYNCLLFIIIPPVTNVHVMPQRVECETKVSSNKSVAKEILSVIYIFDKVTKYKPPLTVNRFIL